MDNTNTEKNVGQSGASGVTKVRFSQLREMIENSGVEMDKPGVLLAISLDGVNAQLEPLLGLEELDRRRMLLMMMFRAFIAIAEKGFKYDPKALGVLGEWMGVAIKHERGDSFLKDLAKILSE